MQSFEHVNATSVESATGWLGRDHRSRVIAGGTDLLTVLKLGIFTPERLVNLKSIPDLDAIHYNESEGLTLGALATLTSILENTAVKEKYRVLYQAIAPAATPQLRNRATIAGNLMQHSRCWYYRGPFHCWLKGGEVCYAKDGENANHAISGGGPCYTVHPSDPAPALIALRAEVRIAGKRSERALPVEKLFQLPHEGKRSLTGLASSEIITEVRIPAADPGSRGTYVKAMGRRTWAFALASVAAQLAFEGEVIREARLVLGGTAPIPWQATGAEGILSGHALDEALIAEAAEAAVAGSEPLEKNKYKVLLVKGIVTEALAALWNDKHRSIRVG